MRWGMAATLLVNLAFLGFWLSQPEQTPGFHLALLLYAASYQL
jgi:hypothetical protein